MKTKIGIGLLLLGIMILVGSTIALTVSMSGILVITYNDGSLQKVMLNQPAAKIARLEFMTGDQQLSAKGFTGRWQSSFGVLELNVNGNKVSGNYQHDNGRIEGSLSADGRTLDGTWSEAPSYAAPADAGRMVIRLAEDGNSFSGTWWYGKTRSADPGLVLEYK